MTAAHKIIHRTLLVVDPQVDFVTGSLAVPLASEAIDACRFLVPHYKHVVVSRDWHPFNHCSFEESGGPWPEHCVAQTSGAMLAWRGFEGFEQVYKGMDPAEEAYSAFDGFTQNGTALKDIDLEYPIEVVGLALDYCVKATAIDAKKLGYEVMVNLNATRGVDPQDSNRAALEMAAVGINVGSALLPYRQYLEALKVGGVPAFR